MPKIILSQNFRTDANVGDKGKNHKILIKLIIWVSFTSALRVGVSIIRLVNSRFEYEYFICMNSMDYTESLTECENIYVSWSYIISTMISPIISISDQITVTLLKLCCTK